MIKFNSEQRYIVTGASSGIGEAVALLLNKLGATVIAVARNEERLENLKSKCQFRENIFTEIKDLTEDIDNLSAYVKALKDKYGKFSGLAYCAGISDILPLRMLDYFRLEKLFKINYFAPMMMAKGIADKRNCIGKGTSLVYISSFVAKACLRGQFIYSASKSALTSSIKSLSKELVQIGIRANCVSPSMIKTPMNINEKKEMLGIAEQNQTENYPFGWGEPDDVANLVVYLLSDKAKFISGQDYVIDSGMAY